MRKPAHCTSHTLGVEMSNAERMKVDVRFVDGMNVVAFYAMARNYEEAFATVHAAQCKMGGESGESVNMTSDPYQWEVWTAKFTKGQVAEEYVIRPAFRNGSVAIFTVMTDDGESSIWRFFNSWLDMGKTVFLVVPSDDLTLEKYQATIYVPDQVPGCNDSDQIAVGLADLLAELGIAA